MPVISFFYGISISMYYLDNFSHHHPHIHVNFGEDEAVYRIPDGQKLEGWIPRNKEKLVLAWIELRKNHLMKNWKLAKLGNPIYKIDPLI